MKKSTSNVADIFKEFCKERHIEDKGRNYNLLQDIYANTELFDLTKVHLKELKGNEGLDLPVPTTTENLFCVQHEKLKISSLPFANIFIKLFEHEEGITTLFIREYSPYIVTGTIYTILPNSTTYNMPFTLYTETGELKIEKQLVNLLFSNIRNEVKNNTEILREVEKMGMDYFCSLLLFGMLGIVTVCNLPKHSVIADTPIYKSEYYPKKQAQGIRVFNRPIYYVLNKKEENKSVSSHKINAIGNLEYTHAFKVRGHWMRISPNSIGKDRNGIRKETLKGITWRTEYIKGEGELVKKVRIIK